MQIVYIENELVDHPRTQQILKKLRPDQVIQCEHYKEVFNPRSQNFRIQKQQPALILAQKKQAKIFPSPEGFGIGGRENYYFSHMLNCLYDCRYCFLQGMYSSAHYVLFINYEDFMNEIRLKAASSNMPIYFFSGYDCDSLAYEPVSGFLREFIPFFRDLNNACLELRTKSTNIKELLKQPSYPHCIVAFSFTPDEISREIEHKVPSVAKRITAMQQVAEAGWTIGLRFDPLIYHPDFKKLYEKLFFDIFSNIKASAVHSVSTGPLRFPEKMYQKIIKLYPEDALLAHPLYKQGNIYSYQKELEANMKEWIHGLLKQYVNETILFECHI